MVIACCGYADQSLDVYVAFRAKGVVEDQQMIDSPAVYTEKARGPESLLILCLSEFIGTGGCTC